MNYIKLVFFKYCKLSKKFGCYMQKCSKHIFYNILSLRTWFRFNEIHYLNTSLQVHLIIFYCITAFISHTKPTALRVTMDQTVLFTVPVIQENVFLMDIPTVKWVRYHCKNNVVVSFAIISNYLKIYLVVFNRMDR